MSALSISVPYPVFSGQDGLPLDNGYVWIGTANLYPITNQIVVYFDEALTIQATQPLRTINGFISNAGTPAQVYVDAVNFSILVQDSKGSMVYNFPDGTGISPNASGVVYDPAGTGAVATTVQTKLRESVSVKDFGAVGDGVTNDYAAIMAAISANTIVTGNFYNKTGKIYFPKGQYYLGSNTITLESQVIFIGESTGQQNPGPMATELIWNSDVPGIVIKKSLFGAGINGADGSIIENIGLNGTSIGTNTSAHGVNMQGRASLIQCTVSNFTGNGINIVASAASQTNANNWVVSNCSSLSNGQNGLFTQGNDANSGTCTALDASSNGGWGILDSSFLGNTYVGCHTASNLGAYKTTNANARNVFLGCYSESGQLPSEVVTPSIMMGGIQGAGFADSMTAPYVSGALGNLRASRGIEALSTSTTGRTVLSRLSGNADNGDLLYMDDSLYAPLIWRLKSEEEVIRFLYTNSDTRTVFRITQENTTYAFGRTTPIPYATFFANLVIGNQSTGRRHDASSSVPTTGERARGEIVWNNAPTAGGFAGWICTTGGTPGTWKTFGVISV